MRYTNNRTDKRDTTELETLERLANLEAAGEYREASQVALDMGYLKRSSELYEKHVRSYKEECPQDLADKLMKERNELDEISFILSLVSNASYEDSLEVLRTAEWYDDSQIPYRK